MKALRNAPAPDQPQEAPLARADWIGAAMDILIDEGVGSIKITRLADRLGVTRGSFYWHFAHRGDLLQALRQGWAERNTPAVIAAVATAETLDQAVLNFFDAWDLPDRFDARLDHAMRSWAKHDDAIRTAVETADTDRIAAIATALGRFGYARSEAFIRARILYFAQIGYFALGVRETMADRASYLETYFRCFTGREIDAAAASRHVNRHLGGDRADG